MTVTPAEKYLEQLKKQTSAFQPNAVTKPTDANGGGIFDSYASPIQDNGDKVDYNAMPNTTARYSNPNEHMTAQNSLLEGGMPASPTSRKNEEGLAERELMVAQEGDIATSVSTESLKKRKTEMERMLAQFGNTSDLDGLGANGEPIQGVEGDTSNDQDPLSNARLIKQIAAQRGLGDDAVLIGIMAGLAESELKNISHGDRDSVGLFQQRTSQGWGSIQQIMNPTYAINKFFEGLQKVNYKGMQPWQAAQAVQRSAFADGSNYQARMGTARQILQQINSAPKAAAASNGPMDPGLNNWINAHNNRYLDYDGAYGAQCVDLYAFYTTGFVGGRPNPVGYAPEIFDNFDSSVYSRFGANSSARAGDVAIWNPGGYTPVGHVAVVVGDNGDGTLRVLQSNATSAGSAGNSIISNISKSHLRGYLRPNKLR